jgi:hypothetical protein
VPLECWRRVLWILETHREALFLVEPTTVTFLIATYAVLCQHGGHSCLKNGLRQIADEIKLESLSHLVDPLWCSLANDHHISLAIELELTDKVHLDVLLEFGPQVTLRNLLLGQQVEQRLVWVYQQWVSQILWQRDGRSLKLLAVWKLLQNFELWYLSSVDEQSVVKAAWRGITGGVSRERFVHFDVL